jgi:hypothetical protein
MDTASGPPLELSDDLEKLPTRGSLPPSFETILYCKLFEVLTFDCLQIGDFNYCKLRVGRSSSFVLFLFFFDFFFFWPVSFSLRSLLPLSSSFVAAVIVVSDISGIQSLWMVNLKLLTEPRSCLTD